MSPEQQSKSVNLDWISKGIKNENLQLDLKSLIEVWKKHPNNPSVGYLKINFLSNIITEQREVCKKARIDILSIDDETTLYLLLPVPNLTF